MTPKVTAVVTHWNQHEWLGCAMESLASQTVPPYEIIIVDDGSTVRVNPATLARDLRNVTVVYAPHGGIGSALNRAIALMRGDVFCWLPADDEWMPKKLETQAAFAIENPDCILHSWCNVYNGTEFSPGGVVEDHTDATFAAALRSSSPYYANTFWIPKPILDRVGPFRENVPASEDYEWVMRSVFRHRVKYRLQRAPLTIKRLHDNMTSVRKRADIPALMRQFQEEYASC